MLPSPPLYSWGEGRNYYPARKYRSNLSQSLERGIEVARQKPSLERLAQTSLRDLLLGRGNISLLCGSG